VDLKYGAKQQFAEFNTPPPFGKEEQTHVQKSLESSIGMQEVLMALC
jgi:hypothetical protein